MRKLGHRPGAPVTPTTTLRPDRLRLVRGGGFICSEALPPGGTIPVPTPDGTNWD
jgi:hypothetical protein